MQSWGRRSRTARMEGCVGRGAACCGFPFSLPVHASCIRSERVRFPVRLRRGLTLTRGQVMRSAGTSAAGLRPRFTPICPAVGFSVVAIPKTPVPAFRASHGAPSGGLPTPSPPGRERHPQPVQAQAVVAQWIRAPLSLSGCRRFESGRWHGTRGSCAAASYLAVVLRPGFPASERPRRGA